MKWFAVVVVAALVAPAAAAGRKILVLPIEGSADAATRSKLTAEVARLARTLGGRVATGTATFADTALAVGCAPQAPSCSDDVIASLGVDELIWGVVTRDSAQTRLVVRRAVRGASTREAETTLSDGDPRDRIAAAIAPLFAPPAAVVEPAREPLLPVADPEPVPTAAPPSASAPPAEPMPPAPPVADDHRGRVVGIALLAGGGVAAAAGIALWVSYARLQRDIDGHPLRNVQDFRDLQALEDRASTRAIAGDVLVAAGLIAGGIGAYCLYRDHQRQVTIAPAPMPQGAGLTLSWVGDLP